MSDFKLANDITEHGLGKRCAELVSMCELPYFPSGIDHKDQMGYNPVPDILLGMYRRK